MSKQKREVITATSVKIRKVDESCFFCNATFFTMLYFLL